MYFYVNERCSFISHISKRFNSSFCQSIGFFTKTAPSRCSDELSVIGRASLAILIVGALYSGLKHQYRAQDTCILLYSLLCHWDGTFPDSFCNYETNWQDGNCIHLGRCNFWCLIFGLELALSRKTTLTFCQLLGGLLRKFWSIFCLLLHTGACVFCYGVRLWWWPHDAYS